MCALNFSLLNDEPVHDIGGEDVLGTFRAARELARLIQASREATPFTIAIDADWGMGKSSLMHRIEAELGVDRTVECVWFNAWTADGTDALEGVIKSVLQRFDRNLLRRVWYRTGRRGPLLAALRLGSPCWPGCSGWTGWWTSSGSGWPPTRRPATRSAS